MRKIGIRQRLPFGLFEYVGMPFGVCNGPTTFQSLIKATMSDLFFQILRVYLGDIVVYSETFEQHIEPGRNLYLGD